MAERMSKEAEEKILQALDRVVDATQEGEDPNDAIVKMAGDFPPGHIRMMVHAFNTGRVNTHRSSGETVFDKASSVKLADADAIIERLFPSEKKEAVKSASVRGSVPRREYYSDYDEPPTWLRNPTRIEGHTLVKAAEVVTGANPNTFLKRAQGAYDAYTREVEELGRQVSQAADKLAVAFEDVDRYFRKAGSLHPDLVRQTAEAAYGKIASSLFDALHEHNKTLIKHAGVQDPRKSQSYFDKNQQPWRSIDCFVQEHSKHQQLKQAHTQLVNDPQAAELRKKLPQGTIDRQLQLEKQAADDDGEKKPSPSGFGGKLRGAVGTGVKSTWKGVGEGAARGFGFGLDKLKNPLSVGMSQLDMFQPRDQQEAKAFESLADPVHELRMRQVQTKAVLHDMLANDPVISAYDPDEVIAVFNDIQRLAPRATSQPSVLRAVLRKHLSQGQLDTHELGQISDMERNLRAPAIPGARPGGMPGGKV